MNKNIAIFASGNGSNAQNIISYFRSQAPRLAVVSLVVTDRPQAHVLERARGLDVPAVYVPRSEWADGTRVLSLLRQHDVDFVVLAGFLWRVPDDLLAAYEGRMVNIHPSLLPKFGGKGMYGDHVHRAVVEAGERQTGITIHYVDCHYDEGTVIAQYTCPVLPSDTADDVARRVHALEYEHYPQVIARLVGAL